MERLTERTADGILVKENYSENALRTFYQCFGGKPNANYSNCEEGYCAMDKLAAYEDAEEQGLLLRVPCKEAYSKSGDYVYFIYEGEVIKCVHCGLKIDPVTGKGYIALVAGDEYPYLDEEVNKIGKTIFLTKEEAEAKLAEMEGAE